MTDADLHTMPLVDQLLTVAALVGAAAVLILIVLSGHAPSSPAGSPDPEPSPAATPTGSGHPTSVGEDPAADAVPSMPASAAEPAVVLDDLAVLPDTTVEVELLTLPDFDPPVRVEADLMPAGLVRLAEAIAQCESGGLWDGRDGDLSGRPPRSTASGRWRFTDPTWRWTWEDLIGQAPPTATARESTPAEQTRAFVALHDVMGTSPWAASQACWGPEVGR